ncbi:hypothetical protein RRG08_001060 [Elysia crispata]|uniref:Uncharacterized protein n=1 Tax=Elysia crispata TaxID=231223 RepID=A0AAE1E5M5_9GAST|nr:hypothetical protein RRG08_001060 [Elysia crispata]
MRHRFKRSTLHNPTLKEVETAHPDFKTSCTTRGKICATSSRVILKLTFSPFELVASGLNKADQRNLTANSQRSALHYPRTYEMAANSFCPTILLAKLSVAVIALVALLMASSVLSAPAARSPLDSCMYGCHDNFMQCYQSNFTYRGELNQCINGYNNCFRICYSQEQLWW